MAATRRRVARSGRADVIVNAPIDAVWDVVRDVSRTGEWSHECRRVSWLGGATTAAPGVRFRGTNRVGPVRWTRTSEVVISDPPHRLTWRTIPTLFFPDSTDWAISLTEVDGGTRIVESYTVTRLPTALDLLYARVIRGHTDRNAALAADLHRIGEVARGEAIATARDRRPSARP
jgi:hypothetical protein